MARFTRGPPGDASLVSRALSAAAAGLTAVALLVAATACGAGDRQAGPPALPPDLADSLAARADAVADRLAEDDACAAAAEAHALVRDSTVAVEEGRVPPALEPELLGGVQDLASRIECPDDAEAAEPPAASPEPDEPTDEPATAPQGDARTLGLGDAGEIEFRLVGDGLELVQVRPAPGWRHSVSADEDELDVDLSRGNREISVAIDAEGGGRFTLDLDYETGRGAGEQTIGLGDGGEVVFVVEGRTLRLLDARFAAGWTVQVSEDENEFELEARHEDGSEIVLTVELDD